MDEQPRGFRRFLVQAKEVVASPSGMQRVVKQSTQKMLRRGSEGPCDRSGAIELTDRAFVCLREG